MDDEELVTVILHILVALAIGGIIVLAFAFL